jgi:hypothetical protein
LTFIKGVVGRAPTWTPDSKHIVFPIASNGPSGPGLYWMRADGAGEPLRILEGGANAPYSFSPNESFWLMHTSRDRSLESGLCRWISPIRSAPSLANRNSSSRRSPSWCRRSFLLMDDGSHIPLRKPNLRRFLCVHSQGTTRDRGASGRFRPMAGPMARGRGTAANSSTWREAVARRSPHTRYGPSHSLWVNRARGPTSGGP